MEKSQFQRWGFWALPLLLLAAVPACEEKASEIAGIGVAFEWNPPGTPVDRNPEIRLTHVPEAAHRFLVELEDLDLTAYNHGGGYYPHNGSGVIGQGKNTHRYPEND